MTSSSSTWQLHKARKFFVMDTKNGVEIVPSGKLAWQWKSTFSNTGNTSTNDEILLAILVYQSVSPIILAGKMWIFSKRGHTPDFFTCPLKINGWFRCISFLKPSLLRGHSLVFRGVYLQQPMFPTTNPCDPRRVGSPHHLALGQRTNHFELRSKLSEIPPGEAGPGPCLGEM